MFEGFILVVVVTGEINPLYGGFSSSLYAFAITGTDGMIRAAAVFARLTVGS